MRPQRALAVVAVCVALIGCGKDERVVFDNRSELDKRVDKLVSRMTLAEKIDQMHGTGTAVDELWPTPDLERLNLPGFRMVDGPRGVRAGKASTFPVGMARGATWDIALEEQVGEAIGLEAAAKGANVILAPTMNVLRHPGWGRAQETYGEDVHHLGQMASAFIEGAQRHVLASAKHFAANTIEDTRFNVNVTMDERTLREIYTRHFAIVVKQAHVASVMSAYNKLDGFYCSENHHLLRDILKGDTGFDGFVESDWILGTRSTVGAALGGLDIEMPGSTYFGQNLLDAVGANDVPESVIDEAVHRIVKKKLEFGLDAVERPPADVVESPEHTTLSLQVEREAIVLLKNDAALLPLDRSALGELVVLGPLASVANLGDYGSSNSQPTVAVSPLEGLQSHAAGVTVSNIPGPTLSASDAATIAAASAVIVVVGLTGADEGEGIPGVAVGGDRTTLELHADEIALIEQASTLNPRTIVVIEAGSAVTMLPWSDGVPAIVMAWYPGMQGGNAVAEVLFGDVVPSGKLPITFPRTADQLPPFDTVSLEVEYGYFHGYRLLDKNGSDPLFAFGHGLSYTTFDYSALSLDRDKVRVDGVVTASFDVTNTGTRAAEEIAELYVGCAGSSVERAVRELRGFSRVKLAPSETKRVKLTVPASELGYYDESRATFAVEPLGCTLWVGRSSRDLPLSASFDLVE